MGVTTRWAVVKAIRDAGVRTLTDVTYREIVEGGILVDHDGKAELIAADTVIIAAGPEPRRELVDALTVAGIAHSVVGGAGGSPDGNAVVAFEEGLRTASAVAESLAVANGRAATGSTLPGPDWDAGREQNE
jgi:2,4-dienoyl-CoA reductase (NADPH2)